MKQIQVDFQKQLKNFRMDMQFDLEGGCLGILGASGSGKSMTLKVIAGLKEPDSGKIEVGGRIFYDSGRRIRLAPQKRRAGYLFQNYALFPNMTVEENIRAGLRAGGRYPRKEETEAVRKLLRDFQLEGAERQYPGGISGGQQQRAALARILASRPGLLLLDEPFSAMDSYLREELQMEMGRRIRNFSGCTILVSHDRDEIYRLCSHTMIVDRGRNVILGRTEEIFQNPRKVTAARLTGCKNISRAEKCGETRVRALDWNVTLQVKERVPDGISHVGIRAHDILPASADSDRENLLPVQVAEEAREPFERTLFLRGREPRGGELWMKTERICAQAPEAVWLPDEKLLLLEE